MLDEIISCDYGRYKGTYCSQDVAIKVLKPERLNSDLQKEFAQEVFIMRFVNLYLTTVVELLLYVISIYVIKLY